MLTTHVPCISTRIMLCVCDADVVTVKEEPYIATVELTKLFVEKRRREEATDAPCTPVIA